jgi:hypothetical protein
MLQLASQDLLDISGSTVSSTLSSGRLTVSQCPNANIDIPPGQENRSITASDYILISRAVLGIIPKVVALHDLNASGTVGDEDRIIVGRILFIYSVPTPYCAVVP